MLASSNPFSTATMESYVTETDTTSFYSFHVTSFTTEATNATTVTASYVSYEFIMRVYVVGTLCLVGFIFNGLSVAVLQRDSGSGVVLLQALAMADTAFLIFTAWNVVCDGFVETDRQSIYVQKICINVQPYVGGFWVWFHNVSTWMVILVTAVRYVAVCKPHQLKYFTPTRCKIAAVCLLFAPAIPGIPIFVFDGLKMYKAVAAYRTACWIVLVIVIPLPTLMVLNVLILRQIRLTRRALKSVTENRASTTNSQKRNDLTVIVVAIVIVFGICQLMDLAGNFENNQWAVESGALDKARKSKYRPVAKVFITINSVVNFIIYCAAGKKFRRMLREMCGCGQRRGIAGRSPDNSNTSTKSSQLTPSASRASSTTQL